MSGGNALRRALVGLALVVVAAAKPPPAAASPALGGGSPPAADSRASHPARSASSRRAPSSPALTSGEGALAGGTGEAAVGSSPQAEADPLVSNGLGSPLCKGVLGAGALSSAARRHCETSGFSAAGAPTGDYGIDVHIDTGLLGVGAGGLSRIVQDLFVSPLWMALVWAVHALVVMLEWSFTIDLLDSPAAGGIGRGLRQMQAAVTEPWLAAVLAVAAVLALYGGVIRRRVADTLAQALAMAAMMVGGMWLIADPTATVGALGGWANQASLGTLAVSARGTAANPGRALLDSMATLFASAIETPWCYLEFGDVGWCRNPARMDPRLRVAAGRIATAELALIGCNSSVGPFSFCVASGSAQARALEHSATLLREARSNGAIFLALPANGPGRNSINESDSLLQAICQSSDATHCRGPTAAQAQFRTGGGTWSRVGGLLLILAGVLGMMLLFGFIALRLLGAAIFSLLYLLLAPAMILAPALGESGRAVFRRWVVRLLGAILSKLLFSFLLGVVLAVLAILTGLEALGWWTQWLLMSAFWWGAFMRRHQALGLTHGGPGQEREGARRLSAKRTLRTLDPPHALRRMSNRRRQRRSEPGPDVERAERVTPAAGRLAMAAPDLQSRRTLQRERHDARRLTVATPEIQARLSRSRDRLERLHGELSRARRSGDRRRAAELAYRAGRIEAALSSEQRRLDSARRLTGQGGRGSHMAVGHGRRREQDRSSFLDAQARLPAATRAAGLPEHERRDYPALASLVGRGREEYQKLHPREQRQARLQIDRELALRRELRGDGGSEAAQSRSSVWLDPARADEQPKLTDADQARQRQREHEGAQAFELARASPRASDDESSVMRDAREVAARRKRQLGRDRR